MRASTIKAWYLAHKWTSLVCTLFMLLLCVTGLPLIFAHEIDHLLGRSIEPPELANAQGPADLDAMLADAQARRPQDVLQYVVRDPEEPEFWFVRLGEKITDAEPSAFYFYDSRTGEMLHEYPLGEGVMNVVLRLHVDMFAGLPGTLFLGFMGLLLAVAIVSGAVIYAPYMKKLRFGAIRRGRQRLKWLDLHNLTGIVTLVWLFAVGLTGVINTLAIPIFGQWQTTHLQEMAAPHMGGEPGPTGSAARAVAAAYEAAPGMELSFMAFPGTSFSTDRHFMAFMQGDTPLSRKLLLPLLIDGNTGKILERRELPWYVSALLLSQPLHFGDYGGMPLKVLWALLDLLAIAVLWSGVVLWLKRRNVSFESWVQTVQGEAPAEAPERRAA